MKNLNEYLNEGLIRRQAGMDMKAKIGEWCEKWEVKGWKINPDLTIDSTFLWISDYPDEQFPDYIQFNRVKHSVNVLNSNIKNLKGFPKKCNDMYFDDCDKLESLEGTVPMTCGKLDITDCKNVRSLKGMPHVNHVLNISGSGVESLKDCNCVPAMLTFNCSNCKNLKSLKGIPTQVESLNISGCTSLTIDALPKKITRELVAFGMGLTEKSLIDKCKELGCDIGN